VPDFQAGRLNAPRHQPLRRNGMNESDLNDLRTAVGLLENPGFGAKLAHFVGSPIEKAIALLPDQATRAIVSATHKAIQGALALSLMTLDSPPAGAPAPAASNWWHLAATATSGAVGGAFGWLALTIELPISTTLIMRSIADVARSEGANLADLQIQLECVQVLALGGGPSRDDATEIGYFVAREAMSKAVSEAAIHLSRNGLKKGSAPAIVRLISLIAQRYSINVTEKAATQLVPVIGAIGGAVINTVFIDHFQNMARGHFVVRRLESRYGLSIVRQNYQELKRSLGS
jgi:hypothetical protein